MRSGSARLFPVHWNGTEAANPPRALIVSHQRLPSHGRATGRAVRSTAPGRTIPPVFVAGDPEKVAPLRARIPDAAFLARDELLPALQANFGTE